MRVNEYRPVQARARTTPLVAVALASLALLAGLSGCGGSTDPSGGVGDVTITFTPSSQGQQISLAETLEFAVVLGGTETADVNWIRGGAIVSQSLTYEYVPSAIGVDTLRVQAAAGDVARNYYWVIAVSSTGTTIPPVVPNVAAGPGPGPADVAVTWSRVSFSTYPLDEYVVAVSFDGMITTANWAQARELGRVTHRLGTVGYEAVFTEAGHGMTPGAEAWFAVRAVDELGQMSPVETNGFTRITTGWWLNGVVRDDTEALLEGVVVASQSPALTTNTDVNGAFRIGPFRSIDRIVLETTSSSENGAGWYDFTTVPLDSVAGRDMELRLIKRHLMDVDCELYGYQFLTYLRHMTNTRFDPLDLANSRLYRWPSWPLKVYVPDVVIDDRDWGGSMRFAMAFWDSVMGENIFEETTDPAEAQLVCAFWNDPDLNVYGRVDLLRPGGGDIVLGDVIPEQLSVYVSTEILIPQQIKVVALHELGHTIGLYNHTACSQSGYLMIDGPSGNLGFADPIHPNEQQAVRVIRSLPQGVDMERFSILK